MARSSIGFRTSATTNAVLELIMSASGPGRLVEFGIGLNAQTLTPVGLGFPAAIGITPTTPVTLLSENAADTSTSGIKAALAWATAPTLPAYFFRRATLGLVSDELVWRWPDDKGIVVPASTSIVLWLFASGSVLDGWAVFEE